MHGTRPSDEFLAISRHENPRHPRAGGASPGIIHSAEQVKIRTGSGRHTEEVQIPEPDDIRAILTTLNLFAEGDPLWRRWRGFMETPSTPGCGCPSFGACLGRAWTSMLGPSPCVSDPTAEASSARRSRKQRGARFRFPTASCSVSGPWYLESGRPDEDVMVFGSRSGKAVSLSNIHTRVWRPLLAKSGAGHFRLHGLRHFHASQLIREGVNLKVAQTELGHSSITLTLDTYAHLFRQDMDDRRERANTLANALSAT